MTFLVARIRFRRCRQTHRRNRKRTVMIPPSIKALKSAQFGLSRRSDFSELQWSIEFSRLHLIRSKMTRVCATIPQPSSPRSKAYTVGKFVLSCLPFLFQPVLYNPFFATMFNSSLAQYLFSPIRYSAGETDPRRWSIQKTSLCSSKILLQSYGQV